MIYEFGIREYVHSFRCLKNNWYSKIKYKLRSFADFKWTKFISKLRYLQNQKYKKIEKKQNIWARVIWKIFEKRKKWNKKS